MVAICAAVLSIALENVLAESDYPSDAPDPNFRLPRPESQDRNNNQAHQGQEYLGPNLTDKRLKMLHISPCSGHGEKTPTVPPLQLQGLPERAVLTIPKAIP